MLSACTITSNSRNTATFFLTALGKSNTELSFRLRLHVSNPTERSRRTTRRGKNLQWERKQNPALRTKTLFCIKIQRTTKIKFTFWQSKTSQN